MSRFFTSFTFAFARSWPKALRAALWPGRSNALAPLLRFRSNGDGDRIDTSILELFDLEIGGIVETPLAIRGRPLAVFEDWFPLVDEAQQGLDLNGDGDLQDGVYHGVRSHLPTPQSIGISSSATFRSASSGFDLALVAQEIDGVDRNGDGDELDAVLLLYDPSPDRTLDSGLAIDADATFVFVGFPDRLFFAADEAGQGADLNGDGDLEDDVLHRMDRSSGEVENLLLDVLGLGVSACRPSRAPRATRTGTGTATETGTISSSSTSTTTANP